MHTIRRVRSSSRCSTIVRRSSWPTGRIRDGVAVAIRPCSVLFRARSGLVLRTRLTADDLGLGDRGLDGLAAVGRAAVVVLVVVLRALAGDRVLELAHAGAELTPESREPLGAEDDQHDEQDDD